MNNEQFNIKAHVSHHCEWTVRLRSLSDGATVSERSRRHPQSHHQRRHCGLDPQSPAINAVIPNKVRNPLQRTHLFAGDSCFRRNDGSSRVLKYLIVIVTLIFFVSCKSLTNAKVTKSESTPSYKDYGGYENYQIMQFFEKNYKKFEYPKFIGDIKISDSKIQFGEINYFDERQYVEYSSLEPEYQLIFEKGLLYPNLFLEGMGVSFRKASDAKDVKNTNSINNKKTDTLYSDTLNIENPNVERICIIEKICCFEELTFLSDSPKVKRFQFWLFSKFGDVYMMNPNVYFFELTNEAANEETDLKSFIENAKLTFIRYAWTII